MSKERVFRSWFRVVAAQWGSKNVRFSVCLTYVLATAISEVSDMYLTLGGAAIAARSLRSCSLIFSLL